MAWKWDNELNEELFEIRKHLHQYPELSFEEHQTSLYIQERLKKWGIPYKVVCDTGIVVDITGEAGDGPNISLRADIDALPITEQSGLEFASKNKGVMHACGHDGHTAILLGAVYHIWKFRALLKGMVRCIFQPGEEALGAAEKMIEAGVLSQPEINNMAALHLWPKIPLGSIGIKIGPVTAASDDFKIEVIGKSGHAARPHEGTDAISIASEIVDFLDYFTTEWKDPVDPLVIHVGKMHGGTAKNVIADQVILEGTIRSISKNTREKLEKKFPLFVKNIARDFGGEALVDYRRGLPAIVNDSSTTEKVNEAAKAVIGEEHVTELSNISMGSDDFGFFAEKVPSCYFRLGIREENEETYDLHHPKFRFNEQVIPIGAKILTQYVFDR
ncbi:amidohydrolase [Siminovitchia fortis]|uniref:Amidohydrolase n=1 Tax=Siminovitchia fortis TaxID=254758 RepID=A0A443ISP2_9BACI|nr:amidohydrolase [Siminovitchia fortis]RWR10081.1 amidohydrolase [Siminovitchia fortis]WHY80702.1 amidohydrolase [Siminovitchia fortis]